jgi:ribosome biogenesis GTPase
LSSVARVAAVHRGGLELITEAGPLAGFVTGRLRHGASAVDLPAVGDRVVCDPESGAVSAVCPRSSALVRAAAGGREPQVLAANVDVVVVVASLTRELSLGRVQRMLTLAADAPASAVVVLSKADLVDSPADAVASVRGAIGGVAPVLPVSVVSGAGVDAVSALLGGGVTGVLLGASGVGKTSLLNALVGDRARATGPVRASDDRGRHTTTRRELVSLASSGCIIDTPGLKLPRIWEQVGGLSSVFSDIEALGRGCRFSDCRHAGEPGCAVAGAVSAERLGAWEQLRREEAWAESRRDGAARRRRKEAVRRIHREQRRSQRQR